MPYYIGSRLGSSIQTGELDDGSITEAKLASSAVTNAKVKAAAAIAYSKLNLSGSILNADINASAAIALSKLAALTSAQIIVGNGSNVAAAVALSGDGSITNAGVLTVSDLTITSEAQGDILYFNGSNWVRLGAGTSGHYLKTQGAAANPVWAAVSAAANPEIHSHKIALAYDSIVSGTFNESINASWWGNFRFYSTAQNAEISYKVYLKAGTYTCWVLTGDDTDKGIISIYIDTVDKGDIDCYGSSDLNVSKSLASISVGTDGIHTVNFKCESKHASSSGYVMDLMAFWFDKTA